MNTNEGCLVDFERWRFAQMDTVEALMIWALALVAVRLMDLSCVCWES